MVFILGKEVVDLSVAEAVSVLGGTLSCRADSAKRYYFVNAHTLNLAYRYPEFDLVLRRADGLLGDGTGIRWAAALRGVALKANLVGTDLVPSLMTATDDKGFSVYLLGADEATNRRARDYCRQEFPGWRVAGGHHGFLSAEASEAVVEDINAANPDLLLVGMGNPLQEEWIDRYSARLNAGLCLGVGGLFDHWGGNLRRARPWVRSLGFEWLQLLVQQPHKARRYLIGNPEFIWRTVASVAADNRLAKAAALVSAPGFRRDLRSVQ